MMQAGLRVTAVAGPTAFIPLEAMADDERGSTSSEIGKPAAAPAESATGYRPAWANPFAKPPEPSVENDLTLFDASDVDSSTEKLAINNLDQ